MSLVEAPQERTLRITDIQGPESVRRRLLSLGFHPGDLIELCTQAIFGGPVLIRDKKKGTCAAIGRGIARRIQVDIVDAPE